MSDQELSDLVLKDPGLPQAQPTQAYWQHIPHALAQAQSQTLPSSTDVAVVGSGITGLSVTRALLKADATTRVTVLDARTLCSGATGRNGGQLVINGAEEYEGMRREYGSQMAGKVVRFTLQTLQRIREITKEHDVVEGSELTEVVKLRAFADKTSFEAVKRGISLMEADHPSLRGIYTIVDTAACAKDYGIHGVVGGVALPAGTVWPYKLVSLVFQRLLEDYKERLNIETNTSVTSIKYDADTDSEFPYVLQTPRGALRAAKIVHCTNGYTGHLLPALRGNIFPVRGTMSVQDLNSQIPNRGSTISWAIHYSGVDPENEGGDGLLYLAQNARSGYFFIGGERGSLTDMLTSDDGQVLSMSVDFLETSLAKFFGHDDPKTRKLISAWSGIMGFTPDAMPLVGRLDESITKRRGQGEYIAGGFNGYGMPTAWLSGEAVASLVMGRDLPEWFPDVYLLTERRLREDLNLDRALRYIRG